MDDSRERTATISGNTTVRITWTPARVLSLRNIAQAAEGLKGKEKERVLQEKWLECHPELPTSGNALGQQLYRMRKAVGADDQERDLEAGGQADIPTQSSAAGSEPSQGQVC